VVNIFKIREYRGEDKQECIELLNELKKYFCELEGKKFTPITKLRPGMKILVSELDGKIIGYISYKFIDNEHWSYARKRIKINNFVVSEKYRGKGIGKKMIDKVFEIGRKLGAETVIIVSNIKNKRVTGYYKKLGFEEYSVKLRKDVSKE